MHWGFFLKFGCYILVLKFIFGSLLFLFLPLSFSVSNFLFLILCWKFFFICVKHVCCLLKHFYDGPLKKNLCQIILTCPSSWFGRLSISFFVQFEIFLVLECYLIKTQNSVPILFYFYFLKILFIYLHREGREGEKHQCVVASHMLPTGDLARNPGMCPDWELNRWPFGSQAQSTEPQQPGLPHLIWN